MPYDPGAIRAILARKNLDPEKLARKTGDLTAATIREAMSQEGNPRKTTLEKIARGLEVDVSAFFPPTP